MKLIIERHDNDQLESEVNDPSLANPTENSNFSKQNPSNNNTFEMKILKDIHVNNNVTPSNKRFY